MPPNVIRLWIQPVVQVPTVWELGEKREANPVVRPVELRRPQSPVSEPAGCSRSRSRSLPSLPSHSAPHPGVEVPPGSQPLGPRDVGDQLEEGCRPRPVRVLPCSHGHSETYSSPFGKGEGVSIGLLESWCKINYLLFVKHLELDNRSLLLPCYLILCSTFLRHRR